MTFTVYKSSLDGIAESSRLTLDEACEQISYSKGWDSTEKLRAAIKRWGKLAKPGTAFTTAASVIVCNSVNGLNNEECDECGSDDIEYGEFNPVEDGYVEQRGQCNTCGRKWIDRFVLSERCPLVKSK